MMRDTRRAQVTRSYSYSYGECMFLLLFFLLFSFSATACIQEPLKLIDHPAVIWYKGICCAIVPLLLSIETDNFDTVFDESIGHVELAQARLIVYNKTDEEYEDYGTIRRALEHFELRDLFESGDYFFLEQYRFCQSRWIPAFVFKAPSCCSVAQELTHQALIEKLHQLSPEHTVTSKNNRYALKDVLLYFFSGSVPDKDLCHTYYFYAFTGKKSGVFLENSLRPLSVRHFSQGLLKQITAGNYLIFSVCSSEHHEACYIIIGSVSDCIHCFSDVIKNYCCAQYFCLE